MKQISTLDVAGEVVTAVQTCVVRTQTAVAQCLHSMQRICQPASSPHIHMARMAGGPQRCDVMGFATSLRPQCPYEEDTNSSVREISVKLAVLKSEATLKCFNWSLCYWIYFKG